MITRVYGTVSEKDGYKYLTIDKGDTGNLLDSVLKKYNQVFSGIKFHIKKINGEEVVYDSDFDKIKFLTDVSLPLGKFIYFLTLTVVIRNIFKRDGIFYPQVYLDDCFYQI